MVEWRINHYHILTVHARLTHHQYPCVCGILPKNWRVAPSPLRPRRKMSQYFGDISSKYCVSKGIDTIFLEEISARRFFGINLEKSAIYRRFWREIGDFSRYIAWSTRSQRSQRATVKVKCATVSRYSAPHQTNYCRGDLNPKPKGLGFSLLAIWANSPLWYKVH